MSSRQRSKQQAEFLTSKHQYFPRTARAINTHSLGYRWWTTRLRRWRRWRFHSNALHEARERTTDAARGGKERVMWEKPEKCPKWLLVHRGGETRRYAYTLMPTPSFTRRTHARVALVRRERYTFPIFMLIDIDAYSLDLQLRSPILRTKSLQSSL